MSQLSGLIFVAVVAVLLVASLAVREHRRRGTLTSEQRLAEDEAADREYEETGGL